MSGPGHASPLSEPSTPSLAEWVADRVIEEIGRGGLRPGQRLIETELADLLSVSRIPLREGLRILRSQGILTGLPRRGVRLIEFDEAWADNLYDVRVALERVASHTVAYRVRREASVRARLDQAVADMAEVAIGRDIFALNASDLAMHTLIYELSASPLLRTIWSAIARHVLVLFTIETGLAANPARMVAQHRELRDVLLTGSAEEIDREVALHVRSGLQPHDAARLSTMAERARPQRKRTRA